jgi:hypothetical protein
MGEQVVSSMTRSMYHGNSASCVSDIITENMFRISMCTEAMEVWLHTFLSWALVGRTDGNFHDPVDVHGNTASCTHWVLGCVGLTRSGCCKRRKICAPVGSRTPILPSLSLFYSHCTDSAIPTRGNWQISDIMKLSENVSCLLFVAIKTIIIRASEVHYYLNRWGELLFELTK